MPGDPLSPARVRIMIHGYTREEDGRVFITPECVSLDELEGRSTPCKTTWTHFSGRGEVT